MNKFAQSLFMDITVKTLLLVVLIFCFVYGCKKTTTIYGGLAGSRNYTGMEITYVWNSATGTRTIDTTYITSTNLIVVLNSTTILLYQDSAQNSPDTLHPTPSNAANILSFKQWTYGTNYSPVNYDSVAYDNKTNSVAWYDSTAVYHGNETVLMMRTQ